MNLSTSPIHFMLAQADNAQAPSAAATAAVAAETQSSPGAPPGAASGFFDGGGMNSLIMIALMFGVFYFLLIRPQQKKAREHQKMIDSIGKGSEIVTNGGLIGRVSGVADKVLTIEISEKVRVRVLRSQVAGIYNAAENAEKK